MAQPARRPGSPGEGRADLGPRDVRLAVVGDALVAGVGDPKALGWVGRVAARTPVRDPAMTVYNLGVRGDSSLDVLGRWREETARRFRDGTEHRVVVAVGAGDVAQGLSTARSRLNLANVLDDAEASGIRAMVVGPPPTLDASFNGRLRVVADAQADVASRRGVPFVDCFAPLAGHEQWFGDLAAGDGTHPGQVGYGLLAWLVLHTGWHAWLGVEPT